MFRITPVNKNSRAGSRKSPADLETEPGNRPGHQRWPVGE